MYKSKWNKKGNIKVGNAMWTYSTLKGNEPIYIKALDAYVVGTCGKHCDGCSGKCYVNKSYRYDSVKLGHARNTIAMREDVKQVVEDLHQQIERAKNKPLICRMNQSGEIENIEVLDIAKLHPEIQFFIYTKNFDAIIPALLNGEIPGNMTVLISIWHEYGIKEFNKVKHLPNVKAFVYDDQTFNYADAGLDIQTYCKAYDIDGKMNHEITCDKCRKCFDRLGCHKVVGCYDH